ncbi:MAG: GNAT family N-acetyltransferase [Eubacterium sp.]|nr:GNAT family N-acetyltransferase [Eubacterium sp.]
MIINYSSEYKDDVLSLLSAGSSCFYTGETYIFNTFGYAFWESSFLFIKGGNAVGFIGVINSVENKSLHVYSLRVNKQYRTENISTLLMEKVVLYANKNKYNTISFTINSSNRRNYDLFSSLAKLLGKKIIMTGRYEEPTFLEITYTIRLLPPPKKTGADNLGS